MIKVLFVCGGWAGHEPEIIVRLFGAELELHGFSTEVAGDLAVFDDAEKGQIIDGQFPAARRLMVRGCFGLGGCTEFLDFGAGTGVG